MWNYNRSSADALDYENVLHSPEIVQAVIVVNGRKIGGYGNGDCKRKVWNVKDG